MHFANGSIFVMHTQKRKMLLRFTKHVYSPKLGQILFAQRSTKCTKCTNTPDFENSICTKRYLLHNIQKFFLHKEKITFVQAENSICTKRNLKILFAQRDSWSRFEQSKLDSICTNSLSFCKSSYVYKLFLFFVKQSMPEQDSISIFILVDQSQFGNSICTKRFLKLKSLC